MAPCSDRKTDRYPNSVYYVQDANQGISARILIVCGKGKEEEPTPAQDQDDPDDKPDDDLAAHWPGSKHNLPRH